MLLWRAFGLMTLVCCLKTSEPIRWPVGTYGIPKPVSGCPMTDGFQWKTGWRSQDTNGANSNNSKSMEFHLDGSADETKVNRSFCIKKDPTKTQNRTAWPPGRYCIYKSGQCPAGLTKGNVYWDDDNYVNSNDREGTLPGGTWKYRYNTEIRFCCKTDGHKNDPITLPSGRPFFLLAYESAQCQMVKWATASLEWIYYDTEHDRNKDKADGKYPFEAGVKHPTIYYCYYQGCNKTLTTANGTFQSPNYPRKYPDGQYCSWRITVNPEQKIHLVFTNFILQNQNNTDGVYVYHGENSTGEVLGVFYGGHPPPKEGIYSSSNHLFLIFKSDRNDSYTGFNASYSAVSYSETTPATTTTQTPEMTSSSSLGKTTSIRETTPTKEGSKKDERAQSEGKGFNVVAVVVPVAVFVFLVALLIAGFVYCKRRRTKKEGQGMPRQVIYERPNDEMPMSIDNPAYDRSSGEPAPSVENPYYDRGFTIPNRGCSPNDLYSEAYTEVYTEVKELDHTNNKEAPQKQNENQNPLYETIGAEAVCNPIYDSSI